MFRSLAQLRVPDSADVWGSEVLYHSFPDDGHVAGSGLQDMNR